MPRRVLARRRTQRLRGLARVQLQRPVDAGRVRAEVARQLAEAQYAAFRVRQDEAYESDFEREVARVTGGGAQPSSR